MHAFFHTRGAQRRSESAADYRRARPGPALCRMQLTVDTSAVTALRRSVMAACGDGLEYLRIEACEHGARMRVYLCVRRELATSVMAVVMAELPGAEFGPVLVLSPAPAPAQGQGQGQGQAGVVRRGGYASSRGTGAPEVLQ